MKKLINLTPHKINLIDTDGSVTALETSGTVARISSKSQIIGNLLGFPLNKTSFGEIKDLPEQEKDTFFIVSSLVRSNSDRSDLISPDTSPNSVVRSDDGKIIGVRGFQV
jgi:hypothetical protein